MIKPIQEVHGLLGARQDIEALSDMQKCRLLVASDSHGEGNTLLSVLKAKGSECDAMVFCGDGASDVMYCVSAALQDGADYMPNVVAFVGGNNDYSKCPVSFDPNNGIVTNEYNTVAVPSRQVVQAAGHTVFVTHGHKQWVRVHNAYALSDEAKMAGADVVLFGHTHVAEENDGDVLYLNPGSLRYPRGDGGTSFAILDLRREGGADASFYHVSATRRGVAVLPFRPAQVPYWV